MIEDEDTGEVIMTIKRATIAFMDGSKIRLLCTVDDCEDALDTFCVGINCPHYRAFNEKGKELEKIPYDSEYLPQFIKRVWRYTVYVNHVTNAQVSFGSQLQ